jgi:hypothetical protein
MKSLNDTQIANCIALAEMRIATINRRIKSAAYDLKRTINTGDRIGREQAIERLTVRRDRVQADLDVLKAEQAERIAAIPVAANPTHANTDADQQTVALLDAADLLRTKAGAAPVRERAALLAGAAALLAMASSVTTGGSPAEAIEDAVNDAIDHAFRSTDSFNHDVA